MANIAHNIKERSTNNYITTGSFNGQLFSYATSFSATTLTTTGTLSAVTGATPANCPQGRVLRATGKKLFPGGSYPGVSTMLIGVYDSLSLLSGFIDPNSSVFALYNHDKPVDTIDAFDLSGNVTHKGPPVFTLGDVIAGRQIRSNTITTYTGTTGTLTLDPSLGQVFRFTATLTGAVTLAAKAGTAVALPGAVVYVMFTNGGNQTFTGDQTTIITGAATGAPVTLVTARFYILTLVSNGIAFIQTSSVQGANATAI